MALGASSSPGRSAIRSATGGRSATTTRRRRLRPTRSRSATGKARRLLYLNRPDVISDVRAFRERCSFDERTIVLGCYRGGGRGIVIFGVTDPRLHGVEQVTAAHELLHAAYERLSAGDREAVDAPARGGLGRRRFPRSSGRESRATTPSDRLDEMHSIFGTELALLPAGSSRTTRSTSIAGRRSRRSQRPTASSSTASRPDRRVRDEAANHPGADRRRSRRPRRTGGAARRRPWHARRHAVDLRRSTRTTRASVCSTRRSSRTTGPPTSARRRRGVQPARRRAQHGRGRARRPEPRARYPVRAVGHPLPTRCLAAETDRGVYPAMAGVCSTVGGGDRWPTGAIWLSPR